MPDLAECIHDLDPATCSVCSGHDRKTPLDTAGFGPPFTALYSGIGHGCDRRFEPGDQIRADGEGNWVHA